MTTEYRIQQLELGQEEIWDRLAELERRVPAPPPASPPAKPEWEAVPVAAPRPVPVAAPRPAPAPAPVADPPDRPSPAPAPAPRRPALSFEDLLGGRILALIGAVAVVLSGAFFLALAISNGWIGETARTVMAGGASLALFAFGVWLHERRGRTYASLSAAGAGLACAFLTVTVAAEVYDLIPSSVALALAMLVGGCGTAFAVRWSAAPIAGIGLIGALLAPVLAGAPQTGTTLALLFVANAAAVGVLLWQRWDWLGFACFLVAACQWITWLFQAGSEAGALLALVAFGALGVGAAVGFELRVPGARIRPSSAILLTLNAIALAGAGWFAFGGYAELHDPALADAWLCFLAVAHLGVGVAGRYLPRISRDVSLLAFVVGVLLADIAFSLVVSGPAIAFGYAVGGVLFAWLLSRAQSGDLTETLAGFGLAGHLTLAVAHLLAVDAPPGALTGEPIDLVTAVLALTWVAGALIAAARLVAGRYPLWRISLDAAGLALVAYIAVLVLDGATLVLVLAAIGATLGWLARRTGDQLAIGAACCFLAGGLLHVLAIEAPPQALIVGVDSVTQAAVALVACAVAAFACMDRRLGDKAFQVTLACSGAVTLLYLASVAIVTAFQPGTAAETLVLDLTVRQQGQVLVSALWGVVGLAALLAGLGRDVRELRIAGLTVLLLTVGKVFLYDLSALGSVYRVLSFLALGALLLAASFAYQRLRPTPLPDLRDAVRGTG